MILLVLLKKVEQLMRKKQTEKRGTSQYKLMLKFSAVLAIFLLVIVIISGSLTTLTPKYRPASLAVNSVTTNITGEMLYRLLALENHAFAKGFPKDYQRRTISKMLLTLSTNISLDDPRSFLGRELPGFAFFDGQIFVAGDGTNYTNLPSESSPPLEVLQAEKEAALQNIEALNKQVEEPEVTPTLSTGDKDVVFIYFTHTRESFLPHLKDVTEPNLAHHSKVNVVQVGERLKSELEKRGIGTIVDQTDVVGHLTKKNLKYWQSYDESRHVVKAALTNNRDLTYLFDIHRDSKRKKATTIKIDGKDYAKLAFVIGTKHANYERNIRLANDLHDLLQKKYPGLSRGVLAKGEKGHNGKYNQDLSENAILIEFGGVDNTFDELYESAAAFAEVFSEYYWEAEAVNK